MEVRYVNSGIANNFGDYVELNENLKKYPKLHDALLAHELKHSNEKGFTKKDFLLDLGENKVSNFELFKFIINHPKSLSQFLPIYKKGSTIFYDINMIIVWGTLIGCCGLAFWIASI